MPAFFSEERNGGRVQDPVPPVPEPWPEWSEEGNKLRRRAPGCSRRRQPHLDTLHDGLLRCEPSSSAVARHASCRPSGADGEDSARDGVIQGILQAPPRRVCELGGRESANAIAPGVGVRCALHPHNA